MALGGNRTTPTKRRKAQPEAKFCIPMIRKVEGSLVGEVEAVFYGREVDDNSMWNQVWDYFGYSHLSTVSRQPSRELSDYMQPRVGRL